MKFKAILFDMDGTIIDTGPLWTHANRLLLEKRGVTYTRELHATLEEQIQGQSLRECCSIIKKATGLQESLDDLVEDKKAIALELHKKDITYIPGFPEFHKKVVEKQLKTGIATNAGSDTLRVADETLRLSSFFGRHMYDISCVAYVGKPDPAIYVHAAGQLQIEPTACIAIEDSAHGIRAAKRAGMFCIGINTAKNRYNLRESDCIVEGYEEIDLDSLLY